MQAQTLQRALSTVSAAISQKSKLAVLREVLLEQGPEGLRLMGTDLETTITVQLPPNGNVDTGALTAPVEAFVKLTKTLKGEVSLALEPETATTRLTAGDLRLALRGHAATEHLNVEPRPADAFLLATADAAALLDALKRVLPAVHQEDDRPTLHCVHLAVVVGETTLTMEGANGFFLHMQPVTLAEPAPVTANALVSLKQVQNLQKALVESAAQTVELYADPMREPLPEKKEAPQRLMYVVWSNADGAQIEARVRLTDGTYPDTKRIIPKEPAQQTISVSARAMLDALKKLKIIEPLMIAIETQAEDQGSLELAAITDDGSELTTRVPCTWEGEALGVLINPVYLEANLKAQPEDATSLELRAHALEDGTVSTCEAVVFRSDTLVALTMPMHSERKGGGCRWQR